MMQVYIWVHAPPMRGSNSLLQDKKTAVYGVPCSGCTAMGESSGLSVRWWQQARTGSNTWWSGA